MEEEWRKEKTGGEGYGEDVYYGVDGVEDCFFGVWEAILSRRHSAGLVVQSEDERRERNIEDERDYKKLKECE